jgi:hypothetical protein
MLVPTASETVSEIRPAEVSAAANGEAKVPAIAHFLPSLTDIAFLMPIMFLFIKLNGARTLLGDGDTGWHVRTGEWILAHGQVPHTDFFSFSRPGAPWFAWEWGWDVLFALLHQRWGLASVVLASLIVVCCTSAALFRLVRRKCNNGLVAIAVTLLATGGCAIHWLARPHLFTLLFFTWTLHLTDRAAEGRVKLLAWLVPLTLVWTNLHGGFFIVFLILACYIGGDLLNAVIEQDGERRLEFLRHTKPWLLTGAACFAVTFINPYGWQLHKHVVQYITDPYQLQHITEFQSMNFHSPVVVYFEPLMVMAILTALWDAKNRRFADVLLSLGWLHLALIAQRNLPVFSIAAAPLVARGVVTLIDRARVAPLAAWIKKSAEWVRSSCLSVDETDHIGRVYVASALPVLLVGALLLAPHPAHKRLTSTYDPEFYPERALPLLLADETHHIFAEDEWGDYLIYHLYPHKQVFVDGRSDFYGDEFGERYLDLLNVKYDWQQTLDKYSIDTIVISPKFALASTLKISRDWRLVYDDTVSIVFRRVGRIPVSLVSRDGGKIRDHSVASSITGDRRAAKPTT